MGEASRDEYKIQSFDAETQQLLKTALKDPGAVDLEKVANVIVDHSLQDCVFSKEAGRMCYAIIQAESKQAGQSVFRRGLLDRLQREYQAREQLRARSLQSWVCYITFICNIFDYLRVNNMPMMALVNPVYDCLFQLAQPESLSREEEASAPWPGCFCWRSLSSGQLAGKPLLLPISITTVRFLTELGSTCLWLSTPSFQVGTRILASETFPDSPSLTLES
ncbi:MIF4G domain-containing protein isoform X1 [Onychomys torridus]|uniref:MIF4G domain-containing protein isoform X1 n=1 Tax=Onychomys torridus TaxID=38674 RepID=UPI00167F284A|nr:MIF4G domain-containing protein isoform X1 [Onychomys torridus]